jgi:hypothetical protein
MAEDDERIMTPDEHGAPLSDITAGFSIGFETRIRTFVHEVLDAMRDERILAERDGKAAAEHEAARTLATELDRLRAEAAERLATEVARTRAEMNDLLAAEVEKVRADSGQLVQTVAKELVEARPAADRRLADEVLRVREEAAAARAAELTAARATEREAAFSVVDHLVQSVRRLDEAGSLTDIFDELAGAAADEAARVAILIAQGEDLRVWRLVGFGPRENGTATQDVFPAAGLVGHALETGKACGVALGSSDNHSGLPFGSLPEGRGAIAVPLYVGGRAVAVIYADDVGGAERNVPAAWPETLEVLARHAARCLEVITATRTVQSGPRPAVGSAGAMLQGY